MRKGDSVSRPDRQSGGTRRARQLMYTFRMNTVYKNIFTHVHIHAIPIVTETHFNFQINSFAFNWLNKYIFYIFLTFLKYPSD